MFGWLFALIRGVFRYVVFPLLLTALAVNYVFLQNNPDTPKPLSKEQIALIDEERKRRIALEDGHITDQGPPIAFAKGEYVTKHKPKSYLSKMLGTGRTTVWPVLQGDYLKVYGNAENTTLIADLLVRDHEVHVIRKSNDASDPVIFDGKDGEMFGKARGIALFPLAKDAKGKVFRKRRDPGVKGTGMSRTPSAGSTATAPAAGLSTESRAPVNGERIIPVVPDTDTAPADVPVPASTSTAATIKDGFNLDMHPHIFYFEHAPQRSSFYQALVARSYDAPGYSMMWAADRAEDWIKSLNRIPNKSERFLNAILGRMFLAVRNTDMLCQLIKTKLGKKLAKLQEGSQNIIKEIELVRMYLGTTAPVLTNMNLPKINPDGSMEARFHIEYTPTSQQDSCVHAILRVRHSLGWCSLDAQLKHLSGDMKIIFEAAPSNRIWYGFVHKPAIELDIVPPQMGIVNLPILVTAVRQALDWAIKTFVTDPAMDDLAFFQTGSGDLRTRGGIFDEAAEKSVRTMYTERAKQAAEEAAAGKGGGTTPPLDPAAVLTATANTDGERPSTPTTARPPHSLPIRGKPLNTHDAVDLMVRARNGQYVASPDVAVGNGSGRSNGSGDAGASSSSTAQPPRIKTALTDQLAGALPLGRTGSHESPVSIKSVNSARSPATSLETVKKKYTDQFGAGLNALQNRFNTGPSGALGSRASATNSSSSVDTVPGSSDPPARSQTLGTASSGASASSGALIAVGPQDSHAAPATISGYFKNIRSGQTGSKQVMNDLRTVGIGFLNRKHQPLDTAETLRPTKVPHYTPAETGHTSGHRRQASLSERLQAAASTGTSPPTLNNGHVAEALPVASGRQRSGTASSIGSVGSSASRPASLASPGKAPAAAPAQPSRLSHGMNDLDGMVSVQPGTGRGMVEPMVPQRNGQVTALGNTPGVGMSRKYSSDSGQEVDDSVGISKTPSNASSVPPPMAAQVPLPESVRSNTSDSSEPSILGETGNALTGRTSKSSSDGGTEGDLASAIEADLAVPHVIGDMTELAPTRQVSEAEDALRRFASVQSNASKPLNAPDEAREQ